MQHNSIPDALKNFDVLPDSAYVRQPVVEGLEACSSATVWRRVKAGTLPAPEKLSTRVTAWNVGKLRRARAARSAEASLILAPSDRRCSHADV
jgi:predicted DNA-binding transcriptional regulator AlpA